MTREETIKILKILKLSYPRFYSGFAKEEMLTTIDLWSELFSEDDSRLVALAVKELITNFEFPPTIADVKNKMKSFQPDTNLKLSDYWNEFKKCVGSINIYGDLQYDFDRLSEPVKRFVGEPSNLISYATMDSETFNSVTKGQFVREIEALVKKENEFNNLMSQTKQLLSQMGTLSLENKGDFKNE